MFDTSVPELLHASFSYHHYYVGVDLAHLGPNSLLSLHRTRENDHHSRIPPSAP